MSRKPRARYLQVKGWWDFQHYPDKVENGWTPTFIKTYTKLLDDYEYNALSEVDRGRLHRLWLLAARLNNKIPWDERYVKTAIRAGTGFRLSTFIDAGMLLEWDENAAIRPPSKPRKRLNQAEKGLEQLYTRSSPDRDREQIKKREETRPVAAIESVGAALALLETIPDAYRDAGTRKVILAYADEGLPAQDFHDVRVELAGRDDVRNPARYANGALKKLAMRRRLEAA